jgi:hypothetical protein
MRFQFKPPQADKPTKAPDIMVVVDVDLLDLYRSTPPPHPSAARRAPLSAGICRARAECRGPLRT